MYWRVSLPRNHGLSAHLRRDFHWLPVRQRIVFKQCLMTYKAVHIGQPDCLNELIQPYQPVRSLRSSTDALLVIPFVRSDFASDAFSVSSPPSGTISLGMFDHARPLSNRD